MRIAGTLNAAIRNQPNAISHLTSITIAFERINQILMTDRTKTQYLINLSVKLLIPSVLLSQKKPLNLI
jgi:hypothetical protein